METINLKNILEKKWKLVIFTLLSFAIIVAIIYIAFETNIISNGLKPLLDNILNNQEIRDIVVKSKDHNFDSGEGGSWKLEESARWKDKDIVEVSLNLESKSKINQKSSDYVMVLDISGSMKGERITNLRKDINELSDELLSNEDNRVSLIQYNDNASILSGFTKDKGVLKNEIDSLEPYGDTNYNAALMKVNELLKRENYLSSNDRNLMILFFTDGYPNIDSPSEAGVYDSLKNEYDNLKVIGIQYDMKGGYIKELERISDEQVIVTSSNLKSKLLSVFNMYLKYTSYRVELDINDKYYSIYDYDDNLRVEGNKLIWELGNMTTGSKDKTNFSLKLNSSYTTKEGFYSTNDNISVSYKLEEDNKDYYVTMRDSAILKRPYTITYDINIPYDKPVSGCNLKDKIVDKFNPYDVVALRDSVLICTGYQFKGWEIADEYIDDIVKLNDEKFIMPDRDIVIRAIWSKIGISKSMSGIIHEKHRLIDQIVSEANSLNGIKILEGTEELNNPIYYYTANVNGGYKNNNFVMFAGMCFKILRTTETGGIRLIYDGLPNSSGVCPYYGNGNGGVDAQLESKSIFNKNTSIGSVGYMYDKEYTNNKRQMSDDKNMIEMLTNVSRTNYYYSDTVTYNSDTGKYTLDNPVQYGTWSDHYADVVDKGRYTCRYDNTNSCEYIYYFFNGEARKTSYVTLNGGDLIEDRTVTLAKNYTGSGPYNLSDLITINYVEWSNNYSKYNNYYACSDYKTTSNCKKLYYIISTTSTNLRYVNMDSIFKYGRSVTYSNGQYTLDNNNLMKFWDWQANYDKLHNNHYTCFNESGVCNEVYYINYATNSTAYYIRLNNGEKVEDAINLMLGSSDINVNKKDSIIKGIVDSWYRDNLINYSAYLDDSVYCNERDINSIGSWNPIGGSVTSTNTNLMFMSNFRSGTSITCNRDLDKFSVGNSGNGNLTYPVGLLSYYEANLIGSSALRTGTSFWTMSPAYFKGTDFSYESYGWYVFNTGDLDHDLVNASYGVRPVITLIKDIEYKSGDGTAKNPYVIDIK